MASEWEKNNYKLLNHRLKKNSFITWGLFERTSNKELLFASIRVKFSLKIRVMRGTAIPIKIDLVTYFT